MRQTDQLFTRGQVAKRWNYSIRTIDRMRMLGVLPWIDISGGRGKRPTVRFSLNVIQEFENKNLKAVFS